MSLAPHQPKINVDDISDDEGNTVPISPVATCSKPDYKEWDLPVSRMIHLKPQMVG